MAFADFDVLNFSFAINDERGWIRSFAGRFPTQAVTLREAVVGVGDEKKIFRPLRVLDEGLGVRGKIGSRAGINHDDARFARETFGVRHEVVNLPRAEGALVAGPAAQHDEDDGLRGVFGAQFDGLAVEGVEGEVRRGVANFHGFGGVASEGEEQGGQQR